MGYYGKRLNFLDNKFKFIMQEKSLGELKDNNAPLIIDLKRGTNRGVIFFSLLLFFSLSSL
jgi:hypothetical protein